MSARLTVSIALLALVVVLANCQPVTKVETPTMASLPKAMKGYELYSWNVDDEWRFALLLGTNRLKSIDEIMAPNNTIGSMAELRARLTQLAPGEEIVWLTWSDDRLMLPPPSVVKAVKQMCQEINVELTLASPE